MYAKLYIQNKRLVGRNSLFCIIMYFSMQVQHVIDMMEGGENNIFYSNDE